MTDKKQDDQQLDAESSAMKGVFEQMNVSDNLQPSTEIDVMILQQAADAVEGSGTSDQASNADIADLSFRRNQIIAREESLRNKKSFLPSWAMPIGLAATVLLSFGVVNRVLDSPEFSDIASVSAPAYDDTVSMKSAAEDIEDYGLKQKELLEQSVLSASEAPETEASIPNVNADHAPNDKYATQPTDKKNVSKISGVNTRHEPVTSNLQRRQADAVQKPLEVKSMEAVAGFSGGTVRAERSKDAVPRLARKNSGVTVPEREPALDLDSPVQEAQVSQQARVKTKESRLNQEQQGKDSAELITERRDRLRAENSTAKAVVSKSVDTAIAPAPEISFSSDNPRAIVTRQTQEADEQADLASSELSADSLNVEFPESSLEEIIVTGAVIDAESRTDPQEAVERVGDVEVASSTQDASVAEAILTEIQFEDRQCQVSYDCSLIALTCEACDCLEAVNQSNLGKYDNKLTDLEISEQCSNKIAYCNLGYCQSGQLAPSQTE